MSNHIKDLFVADGGSGRASQRQKKVFKRAVWSDLTGHSIPLSPIPCRKPDGQASRSRRVVSKLQPASANRSLEKRSRQTDAVCRSSNISLPVIEFEYHGLSSALCRAFGQTVYPHRRKHIQKTLVGSCAINAHDRSLHPIRPPPSPANPP